MTARDGSPSEVARAPAFGELLQGMRQEPQGVRILIACTLAACATAFEPGYLTLSTSVVQAGLRTPNSQAPLVLATAFLALALITLVAGALADLFGRRRILRIAIAGLAVANLLGLITLGEPSWFVVADALTTTIGAIVLPAAVAIITLAFPAMVRPLAYGVLFGCQAIAQVTSSLLVPLLGGWWDGRASFLPVLALLALAAVLVRRDVPASRGDTSVRRSSVVLNVVFVCGLFTMMYLVVTSGIRTGESLLALATAALLLLLALGVRGLARRSRQFRGVELYGGRDLGLAIFAGLMLLFAQGCFFYQTFPYFQTVQETGEVATVLRYVPYVVGLVVGGLAVARLALRFGQRLVLVLSFAILGVALLSLSFLRVDTPFWVLILPVMMVGLAAGLGGSARTEVVMAARPPGIVGGSAAINVAAGQSGYALGVIVSSVLVTQSADRLFLDDLRKAGVAPEIVGHAVDVLGGWLSRLTFAHYPNLPDGLDRVAGVSYANAFTTGLSGMLAIVAAAMFVTAVVIHFGMTKHGSTPPRQAGVAAPPRPRRASEPWHRDEPATPDAE